MKDSGGDWVEVQSCGSLPEAHVVQSVLDSAGIDAMIPDEYVLGVYGGAAVIGRVRVLVHREDAERAAEVLAVQDGPQ